MDFPCTAQPTLNRPDAPLLAVATQRAESNDVAFFKNEADKRLRPLIYLVLDLLFVVGAIMANVPVERFIFSLNITDTDRAVLIALHIISCFYALALVGVWMYKDLRVKIAHANRAIAAARTSSPTSPTQAPRDTDETPK